MAGVVNATFAAGTLTITAVDDLTPAGLAGGLNDQSVSLVGGAAGLVTVAGLAGTTVTGGTSFAGVNAIKLDMKLGNDSVQLQSVLIFGGLTYLGGDGASRIVDLKAGGDQILDPILSEIGWNGSPVIQPMDPRHFNTRFDWWDDALRLNH